VDLNVGIASEVGGIEGEDATDSMSRHQGGYARVVDLLTTHAVCAYHRFPVGVEGIGLPENGNQTLEDSRAFASEPVTDMMEVFVSPGAVRAVQDKLNEEQLKKADAVVERFALAVVRLASRQDDGSRIVEEEAVQAAEKATCPVYPFCSE